MKKKLPLNKKINDSVVASNGLASNASSMPSGAFLPNEDRITRSMHEHQMISRGKPRESLTTQSKAAARLFSAAAGPVASSNVPRNVIMGGSNGAIGHNNENYVVEFVKNTKKGTEISIEIKGYLKFQVLVYL
jgi:hypothetical protein